MYKNQEKLPEKVVERLSEYRQLLNIYQFTSSPYITSAGLAKLLSVTQETIRRDLMLLGCQKSSMKYGYNVHEIIELIDLRLDLGDDMIPVALVGDCSAFVNTFITDYLGKKIEIAAVFNFGNQDNINLEFDLEIFNFTEIPKVVSEKKIEIALLNVSSDFTEQIAEILVKAGIKAIINYSPKRLFLPPDIYLEEVNLITKLEKAIYFSHS